MWYFPSGLQHTAFVIVNWKQTVFNYNHRYWVHSCHHLAALLSQPHWVSGEQAVRCTVLLMEVPNTLSTDSLGLAREGACWHKARPKYCGRKMLLFFLGPSYTLAAILLGSLKLQLWAMICHQKGQCWPKHPKYSYLQILKCTEKLFMGFFWDRFLCVWAFCRRCT